MPGSALIGSMPVGPVGQAVVDLVAVDEEVVVDRDPGQLVLDGVRQDRAGRVARIAQEERLRARGDRRLDRRRVEREIVLEAGGDVADDPAREDDRRHVGNVRRFVEDHLVARIARRAQGKVDGLRGTDRDQDLVVRVVPDAVAAVEMGAECAPQLERAEVRGVVGPTLAQALDTGLDDNPGRVEIRLPNPEADDVVHRRQDVEEATNP